MKAVFISLVIMFVSVYGNAQCTTIGQTPSTAFPVCGIDTFTQQSVPLCSSHSIIVPGCPEADGYSDKNPFWYTFTCYVSGTLGFLITPNDLGDDYDWQLYDITNHLPSDVFTDSSLVVTGNWCGTYGLTGASDTGVDFIQCASVPQQNLSAFSAMPNLIAGHKYLLLISHFTDSQSGYQLTFGGGTCSITDPNIPSLKNVQAECNRSVIGIKISKDVRCNSLASDGSDFSISTPLASIISATGVNCNNEFDLDSVLLILSNPLPPGNYSITAKIGSDGNTLLDDCHNSLPVGDQFSFTVLPVISSAFTYQIFYGCKSDSIQFTNPGGNGITKWQWTFDSAFQSISQSPFFIDTIYGLNTAQLIVSNGVCNDTSTASFSLDNELKSIFTAPDNVCPTDKATFENNSIGNVTAWYWDFGDGTYSTDSVPEPHMFPSTLHDAKYTVRLILENSAGCYDTSSHVITRVQSCYIAVPSGFTPNGDGINDYLYPLNAYKAINLEFRVYNRYGQLVFETKNWMNKWDGTINGKQQPTGTYVWMLNYTDSDSGKKYFLKGTSVLIR